MKPSERVIALIREIEVRPGQTAPMLAKKFDCCKRTIMRDINERFPELGVIAVSQNGYRFLQKPHLRALALTHEELVSIILAHKVAEPSLDETTAQALSRVTDKIRQGLPTYDRKTAATLEQRTAAGVNPETQADTSTTLFAELTDAVTDHERIEFAYQGRGDQAPEIRLVEPLGLFFQEKRWYLHAFDVNRQGTRTFRLARISDIRPTNQHFQPKEDFCAEKASFHQYDIAEAEPVTLELHLETPLARWFEENKPHPSVQVQGNRVTVTVTDPKAFLRWFASLDGARVVGPAEYRDWFVERLGGIVGCYSE